MSTVVVSPWYWCDWCGLQVHDVRYNGGPEHVIEPPVGNTLEESRQHDCPFKGEPV